MRHFPRTITVGLLALAACSGDDATSIGSTATRDSTAPPRSVATETGGAPETSAAETTTSPISDPASPSTSEATIGSDDGTGAAFTASQVVGLVLNQVLQMGGDLDIDQACFDAAIARDAAVDESDLAALEDPAGNGWAGLDPDARESLLRTHFRCRDDFDLPLSLYLGLLRGPLLDDLDCVLAPWRARLNTDVVVSSLAVTSGLDDVSPSLTADLAADVVACADDAVWWVDDVAIRLGDTTDLSESEAQCVAAAIVDLKGVQFVVDRRLATVPVWVMSPSDTAALDLAGRCGVSSLEQPRSPMGASRGACVNLGETSFGTATVVPCEGSHSGEVLGVFPMGDASTPWPGYRALITEGQRCGDTALLSSMPEGQDWGWSWDAPTRNGWEAGDRDLTCLLIKGGQGWEGLSGYAT